MSHQDSQTARRTQHVRQATPADLRHLNAWCRTYYDAGHAVALHRVAVVRAGHRDRRHPLPQPRHPRAPRRAGPAGVRRALPHARTAARARVHPQSPGTWEEVEVDRRRRGFALRSGRARRSDDARQRARARRAAGLRAAVVLGVARVIAAGEPDPNTPLAALRAGDGAAHAAFLALADPDDVEEEEELERGGRRRGRSRHVARLPAHRGAQARRLHRSAGRRAVPRVRRARRHRRG